MSPLHALLLLCLLTPTVAIPRPTTIAAKRFAKKTNVNDLEYEEFPKRTNEEAAVIEWGHSAIINAVDGVVANFGVQPTLGAFFEVEATPVLGVPLDGYIDENSNDPESPSYTLTNCDALVGNILILTSSSHFTPVDLASKAAKCEAAALVVVYVFEENQPEYIFPMKTKEGEEEAAGKIDFPVIMISLTSGNMLASAGPDGASMPERVRMYAGGDRPYFEDVSVDSPMVYLIHNLLANDDECEYLVKAGEGVVVTFEGKANYLEGTEEVLQAGGKVDVSRGMFWRGMLKDPTLKAIDERIQQVTGFPPEHLSDFQVNKYVHNGFHSPHYDSLQSLYHEQSASILIFLNDVEVSDATRRGATRRGGTSGS